MNLNNFEKDFDTKILKRGENYYRDGAVLSIEMISDNEYTADVEGYEIYEVTVEMDDNGNIEDITCDCPYDMGEYCKHEAAVLYALRDKNTKIYKPAANQPNLPQLLAKCNDTQLVKIILEHAKDDKNFANYLHMKLSENSDYNSIMSDFKHISDLYFRRRSDIEDVLKAGGLLVDKTEKLHSSVEKVKVYAEVITMLENDIENSCNYEYNEEDWELFETISDCSACMESAVKDIVKSQNEEDIAAVWDCIIQHWNGSFRIDGEERFFPSFLQLCSIAKYRTKLDEILALRQISADEYRRKEIDNQRFSIIKKYGTRAEIVGYINSHINNPDFRRLAIERAINSKNYIKAEQLALEGIDLERSTFSSVSCWHYLLHDIYKRSGNTKKLVDICYALIKDGKTDYYEEWKLLVPEENRSEEIDRLLNESRNYSYEYIISYENMTDRIYKLCCEAPRKISSYYAKLRPSEFMEQSKNLYEQYIRNNGKRVSNRSEYAAFCEQLKKFSTECDPEIALKIAADFRELYRGRPAFIDELTKAGFRASKPIRKDEK